MVLELAEREPVVFIVEDLHWTDPSTLELLDFLVDQTPTASIYVLLTSRPEFQAQWANQSYVSQMTLNRLPRDEIEQMAIQVAGGKSLPREVLQELVEKTDGVPLYLEEMTKAVLESGLLKEGDERYEHTDFISTLSIPTTLQSSLMARLDRLATAKAVAQYAAVIGRQFSYELLQAVSQLDDAMLQHELGRLLEAELIYQRGLPPQATYTFKHALIQDTAYESLLRRTRQHYHSQIAHALETRFSESAVHQPELLAHHYTEAGLAEQAVAYWQQAGQRAIQGSANVEAIAHLTKGLALLRTQPETPVRLQQELALEVALGSALLITKGYGAPEVERIYARAQALCQQLGDTPQLFPVLRGLILYYVNRGDIHTASQLGEQLMHLAESQCDPALLLLAHYMLGVVLSKRGQSTLAYAHHMQALTIYNPQAHRHLALRYGTDLGVAAHSFMAMELWQLGSPDAALGHIEAARTLAQEVSHPFSLVQALFYGAVLHQHRREAVAAQEQAAAMITLATEQGFAQRLAWGQALHGWALALQGKCEVGMTEMRQGIAADLATGARLYQPYFLSLLAEGYRESGRPEAGLQTLSEGLAVIDNTEMFWHQAELHRLKGELLLRQAVPDTSQAESCFQLAVDIARNQEAKSWELRAAVSLACLWQFQDKCQDAYNLLAPVYNWFTEGFDTADLKEAKTLLEELRS